MARYARFRNADNRYVWDRQKNVLYAESCLGDDEYQEAKFNVQQLSKFAPNATDDGEFDSFPGKIMDAQRDKKAVRGEFSSIVDGKETDAPMLEEMLKNPTADLASRIDTARRAIREFNISASEARRLFDIPDDMAL